MENPTQQVQEQNGEHKSPWQSESLESRALTIVDFVTEDFIVSGHDTPVSSITYIDSMRVRIFILANIQYQFKLKSF